MDSLSELLSYFGFGGLCAAAVFSSVLILVLTIVFLFVGVITLAIRNSNS